MSHEEKPHSKFRHVYAIVRFDLPPNAENPENTVSVVKVFSSRTHAEHEIVRLNGVNASKACRYVLQVTKLIPWPN